MKFAPLLAVLLCALTVAAQTSAATAPAAGQSSPAAPAVAVKSEAPAARRVLAPCDLLTASMGPSGEDSPTEGRGFGIHIINNSAMTLDLPSYPIFGWRVDVLRGKTWKFRAEGGPVRRVGSPTDPHLAVIGNTGSGPMVHIGPTLFREYRFFLHGANQAMRHEGKLTTLKLSLYWAATSAMKRSDPAVPNCGITAEWIINVRPNYSSPFAIGGSQ